jgi:hypothetical protein
MIADEPYVSKGTFRKNFVQDIVKMRSAAILMPRNLTEEQKNRRFTSCMYFEEKFQIDVFNVNTGPENREYGCRDPSR